MSLRHRHVLDVTRVFHWTRTDHAVTVVLFGACSSCEAVKVNGSSQRRSSDGKSSPVTAVTVLYLLPSQIFFFEHLSGDLKSLNSDIFYDILALTNSNSLFNQDFFDNFQVK